MNRLRIGRGILFGGQVLFVIIAALLIEWLQESIRAGVMVVLDFSLLASPLRWGIIVAQTALSVYIVSIIINSGYDQRRNRTSSRLCRILKTNELRVDKIYEAERFDDLDKAVERVNENAKRECYLFHMRKINARIMWTDLDNLITTRDIADFKRRFLIGKKEKALNKAVNNLLGGKYTDYEILTSGELLTKGTFKKVNRKKTAEDDRSRFERGITAQAAVRFFVCAALMTVIIVDMVFNFTAAYVLGNLLYIASAVFCGVRSMQKYVNHTEQIFDYRNDIFSKDLGIKDEYVPPKPPVQEPKKKKENNSIDSEE